MCGLVGMISRATFGFQFKEKGIFEQLLFTNTLRGQDSTGIFGVNKYGNVIAHKTAQAAPSALKTQTFKDFFTKMYADYRIVIGHNRASTRGATTDENAHPFIEENICLVHNGTLHTHKQLADTEVDSHAICTSLAKNGYQETFEKIDGAFALIWYDAAKKKLYMARNKERPLYMVVTDDTFYFASELSMLEWVLRRNGIDKFKSYFLSENKTYIWDLDNLKEFEIEETPEKKTSPTSTYLPKQRVTGQPAGFTRSRKQKAKQHSLGNNTQLTLGLAHTTTTTEKSQYYIVGSTVDFWNSGVSQSRKGNNILTGYTIDVDNVPIVCSLPEKCPDETLDAFHAANWVQGTIQLIYKQNGEQTLHLRNPIILRDDAENPESFPSRDGKLITQDDITDAGGHCEQCGTEIEFEKEAIAKAILIKNSQAKTVRLFCKHCVDDNIRWGVMSPQHHGEHVQ